MSEEIKRKKFCRRSLKESLPGKDVASDFLESAGGVYFCDYSPRYLDGYSIYDKAKEHARMQRKMDSKKVGKKSEKDKKSC